MPAKKRKRPVSDKTNYYEMAGNVIEVMTTPEVLAAAAVVLSRLKCAGNKK